MTDKLIAGFERFRSEAYEGRNALMPQLAADGQKPDYFIISCIDSRANPGIIFKTEPGTFFAHKAMGAIVRPYKKGTALAAALQFALQYNQVSKLIVLGHTGCGAVKALVENIDDEEISSFVEVARAGVEKAKQCACAEDTHDDIYRHSEEQIVLESVSNLMTYPSVQKAITEGRAEIKPWLFDMSGGDLLEYDENVKAFTSLIHQSPLSKSGVKDCHA